MKNYFLHVTVLFVFSFTPARAQLTGPNGEHAGAISALNINGNHLYAGTVGGGVWQRPISDMLTDVKNYKEVVPSGYFLAQNYPNPFNPGTKILYSLEQNSEVNLTLFNSLGQQVMILYNGIQEAGAHELRFNAAGLSSGVYFYRLKAGPFIQTRKLVILR